MCPLCSGNGILFKYKIFDVEKCICDECEAIFDSFKHIENIVHYRIADKFMRLHPDLYSWDKMTKLKCEEVISAGYEVENINEH